MVPGWMLVKLCVVSGIWVPSTAAAAFLWRIRRKDFSSKVAGVRALLLVGLHMVDLLIMCGVLARSGRKDGNLWFSLICLSLEVKK